jgi:hypothetical protein
VNRISEQANYIFKKSDFSLVRRAYSSAVEQGTHNPLVPGSNPGGPKFEFSRFANAAMFGGKIHLVDADFHARMIRRRMVAELVRPPSANSDTSTYRTGSPGAAV